MKLLNKLPTQSEKKEKENMFSHEVVLLLLHSDIHTGMQKVCSCGIDTASTEGVARWGSGQMGAWRERSLKHDESPATIKLTVIEHMIHWPSSRQIYGGSEWTASASGSAPDLADYTFRCFMINIHSMLRYTLLLWLFPVDSFALSMTYRCGKAEET